MSKRVLIVEDHETILEVLSLIMKRRGYEVTESRDGKDALDIVMSKDFDIVITDMVLQTLPGIEVIRKLRERDAKVRIIAISGKGRAFLEEAMLAGANFALEKPFSINEVIAALDSNDDPA
jgi:DNA-binding response OmpR family regulator